MATLFFAALGSLAADDSTPPAGTKSGKLLMFVGTYTKGKSAGIARFRLDLAAGKVEPLGITPTANPSFLATDPLGRFLYAVSEIGNFTGKKSGGVAAFAIVFSPTARHQRTGELTPLGQQPSGGDGPCHLSVDSTGKNLLVANYGGGSFAVLPIGTDGRLHPQSDFVQHYGRGPDAVRQEIPAGHAIATSPDGRFVLAADLGLDKVFVYRFDAAKGKLVPNDPPWAKLATHAGPRHFAFSPDGRFVYVANEVNSTVTALAYDAQHGAMTTLQSVSTLPENFSGKNTVAEIEIDPTGRFLYCSNRGDDSLAIFAVDRQTGRLSLVGHHSTGGKTPRHFTIDPSGEYLLAANQDSGNIVIFRRDAATGQLQATGMEVKVDKPVCIKLLRP